MITLKTESLQGTLGEFSSSVYLSVISEGPPAFPLYWRESLTTF